MLRFHRPRSPMHLARQVAAAALACLALVLALRTPPPVAGPARERSTVPVVVAAVDLPAGTVLADDDLTTASLPADAAPAGGAAVPEQLRRSVLAAPVRAGEAITDVRLVGPGLWSQLPDGQVAAPVRLADLAVATLLRPGDRVDVLAATGDESMPSVEVVAERALVLTVPTPTDPPGAADAGGTGLLVLAVPPGTAQRLAAAGAGGSLTVTLGRP